jgi:hypothetical protein
MAVNNIVKLVPGWGSAFAAATSFASTFALGKVMDTYFVEGKKADSASLEKDFKAAQKDGQSAYAEHKGSIEALEDKQRARLEKLSNDLNEGKITLDAFERDVASLD